MYAAVPCERSTPIGEQEKNEKGEKVKKVDLAALEEGDIVIVTTSASQYRLEILEEGEPKGKGLRISVTESKRFPTPTEVLGVGTKISRRISTKLNIEGRMLIIIKGKGMVNFLTTSPIRSIEILRA